MRLESKYLKIPILATQNLPLAFARYLIHVNEKRKLKAGALFFPRIFSPIMENQIKNDNVILQPTIITVVVSIYTYKLSTYKTIPSRKSLLKTV